MPQNIYDNADFFQGYSQFRRSIEGLAGAPEWQVLKTMLPPMQGLRVLDLGCGFGAFARWARAAGARSVLGIDLSEKMLQRAHELTQDPGIQYVQADIGELDLASESFDLIYSSLALHYIEDLSAVYALLHPVLVPGGHLVFSVEHPLYTAPRNPNWQREPDGTKVWPLTDYLSERLKSHVRTNCLSISRIMAI